MLSNRSATLPIPVFPSSIRLATFSASSLEMSDESIALKTLSICAALVAWAIALVNAVGSTFNVLAIVDKSYPLSPSAISCAGVNLSWL